MSNLYSSTTTSSSADSESTAMSEDGAGGDGDVADDDKADDKVEAATVAAEMEVEDGTEVSGGAVMQTVFPKF